MKHICFLLGTFLVLAQGCAHHNIKVVGDTISLTLIAPRSNDVQFACSLDGFALHPARKMDDSTWEIKLPSGNEFSYFYLVDGKVFVPNCIYTEWDEFGSINCMYVPGM
jgi:hypothetical protein